MNILQILPSLDIGGVETGTVDLARFLASKGHKAIVVSGGGRLVRELDGAGVRHYTLPVGKKSPLTIVRMIVAVREVIRREDIDIVHARSRVPALTAYLACRATNRIFITTAHGYYKKHLMSAPMSWGRFVIVASNIMARHMAGDFGVPHERIRLIPRGVDLEHFTLTHDASRLGDGFTIGMVSRITPLKGHADFIRALAILNRYIPKLKGVIAGSSPKEKYSEDLKLLTRRLGLAQVVEFIGPRQDVPEVMSGFDVLVSATVTPEAFGRVIIEAQALGVPVVATKVGGVVDIVEDGKTGLLCMPGDPKEMADKILRFYREANLRGSISDLARKKVEERFSLNVMTEGTLAVYEEALRVKNILVIKISAAGDVILSVPSLRALREKFPEANIKVLVGLEQRGLLDNCPYINDRIVCDFKGRHAGPRGLAMLGEELRRGCFDIVLDLQNNRKSHILGFLSLAGARYGYDNGKLSFLLNRRIKDDAPYLDPIEHQFRVLRSAGARPHDKRLELWPSAADEASAERILADGWTVPGQPLVGINVRASSRWFSKNWPPAYIAELCDRLAKEFGARTVLTGSKDDIDYAGQIIKKTRSKPISAVGNTSILELACLMKHFRVYLTPDSAPMHVASAIGTPFIALFGPTDYERHLAAPRGKYAVLCKSKGACGPCYKPSCSKKVTCMRKITVDEVFEAMRGYLEPVTGNR